MPTQHSFLPQHLAWAIALALGCAEVSMAQSVAEETRTFETTAEMQARLKAFAIAGGTKIDEITAAQETALSRGDDNNLLILKSGGHLIGLTDGGGGANVLQLDSTKGGESPETRNFQDLHIKPGEWSNSRVFNGNSLIDPKAKLINTGAIGGAVHVLGEFANQGTVAGPIFVGKRASSAAAGRSTRWISRV